jgi:hypothetical protein
MLGRPTGWRGLRSQNPAIRRFCTTTKLLVEMDRLSPFLPSSSPSAVYFLPEDFFMQGPGS